MFTPPPTTTITTTLTRSLPPHPRSRHHALAILHAPPSLIELGPLLARYAPITASTSPVASAPPTASHYLITEKIPYLPFGLWEGELAVHAAFEETSDGLRTRVVAPMGFVSVNVWRVREGGGGGGDGEGWVVEEEVEMRCPWGLGWYAVGTMRKSHKVILGRFVEEVARRVKEEEGGKGKVEGER